MKTGVILFEDDRPSLLLRTMPAAAELSIAWKDLSTERVTLSALGKAMVAPVTPEAGAAPTVQRASYNL